MSQLSKESFEKLCKCFDIVGQFCTDLSMKNGIVRQMSDDRVIVLEINTGLDLTMNMSDVKRKSKVIQTLNGDTIDITTEGNMIAFSDGITKINFAMAPDDILINSYIEDLSSKIPAGIHDVFSYTIDEAILKKIKVLSDVFNIRKVDLKPNGSKYELYMMNFDKTQNATICKIPCDNVVGRLTIAKDVFIPFDGEIAFTVSGLTEQNWFCCKATGIVGGIELTVFARLALGDDE